MAFKRALIAIAIVAAAVSPALAKDFVVGDGRGWTTGFDYGTWAAGKEFRVGDKLVFNYREGFHTVVAVDGTGYEQCVAPASSKVLATGNDVITLDSPGSKWYICTVAKHCELGMQKLAITVLPQLESPAPSPSAGGGASAASGVTASKFYVWITAALGFLVMIMV